MPMSGVSFGTSGHSCGGQFEGSFIVWGLLEEQCDIRHHSGKGGLEDRLRRVQPSVKNENLPAVRHTVNAPTVVALAGLDCDARYGM